MIGYAPTRGFKKYIKIAKKILANNWTGAYTKPSPSLYPHQWNWDSGFIAMGYAHYDQKKARQEIISLFQGQWENGMVPQIVFNKNELGHYFPEPDFWQVPDGKFTSGITMPPLYTIACLHIFKESNKREMAKDFLKTIFPKLMASHHYFYRFRDPKQNGLVYIRHPWESGIDNSPAWDGPLQNIHINPQQLPQYERKDLKHGIPAEHRPKDDDYDRYVYLVNLFRRLKYQEEEIYKSSPFLIQDILFNSILCRANQDLVEIGEIIHRDIGEVKEWVDQTSRAVNEHLWCPECGTFESYDINAKERIHTATAAGFMPLFAGAASASQVEILYPRMNTISFCALHQGNCFTIPNYDMTQKDFNPQNYWRGPVWININWMLSQGLAAYGYREKADAMKKDMLQLPIRFGFHEYFDSITGQGYGSADFSWTASLFLDLVYRYYHKDMHHLEWFKGGEGRRLNSRKILNSDGDYKTRTSKDTAGRLMVAIRDLKDHYYHLGRGLVDYSEIKKSDEYQNYLEIAGQLKSFDPSSFQDSGEKKAFWINLYNTIVVHGIIDLEIRSSVREIRDFFKHVSYQIGDYCFSADEMEHAILRANARPPYSLFRVFKSFDSRLQFCLGRCDPRIHFALVCGSRSCAPIGFYEAKHIDEQLNIATRNFINSSEVVITPEENKIFLSQIFKWYKKDFGGIKRVFHFLLEYLDHDEKREFLNNQIDTIQVEYLFYDWNLNH